MNYIKNNKLIASILVGTNMLAVGSLAASFDKKPSNHSTGKSIENQINFKNGDHIIKYFTTKDQAIEYANELSKDTTILSSELKQGVFDIKKDIIKSAYVTEKNQKQVLADLQKQITDVGGKVISSKLSHQKVKEAVASDTSNYSTEFTASSKEKAESKAKEYAKSLIKKEKKNTDTKMHNVNYDLQITPVYVETTKQVNDDSNIEYEYAYHRDTAHGLIFDDDQAEVYLIAHSEPRTDLIAAGYECVDISLDPVRRWDTTTYDIIYTYRKPIVKTQTITEKKISKYNVKVNANVIESEYKEVEKNILKVSGTINQKFEGFMLTIDPYYDPYILDPNSDKKMPDYDWKDELIDEMDLEDLKDIPNIKPKIPTIEPSNNGALAEAEKLVNDIKGKLNKLEQDIKDEPVPLGSAPVHTGDDDMVLSGITLAVGLSMAGATKLIKDEEVPKPKVKKLVK